MSSQRPARWQPPRMRRGTPITLPVSVVELPSTGAEDVLIDRAGALVTGLTNGDVVRVSAEGSVVLGNTGGRPLGIEEYPDGNLLVCDHDRGLLRLDVTTGQVEVLVDEVDGQHLHFCSNAVICGDGTIYFSSSSQTATWQEFRADVINHATSGCLTRVRSDGEVTVLCSDLAFANGLALAPDESYLLVAETIGYRILKFWIKGPHAGQWVDFVSGTPGFPDNISLSASGLLWVSSPRSGSRCWISSSPATRSCGSWRTGFRNVCNPSPGTSCGCRPTTSTANSCTTSRPRIRGFLS
jgi:sugar lactone lactonase YvrE